MEELFAELSRNGIKIGLEEDGRLRVRAAKGALTPALRELLSANKPQLVAWLRSKSTGKAPAIQPVSRTSPLPLSFAQQRLWVLEQLENAGAVYNVPAVFRLTGRLDLQALRGAFSAIIARHEVLRTTFTQQDHQPVQQIVDHRNAGPMVPDIPLVDLSSEPEPEQAAALVVRSEINNPFDLEKGPLLRVRALRLNEDQTVLMVNMHHVVTDGWSLGIFMEEFAAFYRSLWEGSPHGLKPLPIQYADYAAWQRQQMDGRGREDQISYWRKQLAGLREDTGFPTDMPRPAKRDMSGAVAHFRLDAEIRDQLEQLARQTSTSLFVVLMTAFQLWQRFYCKNDDIIAGTDFGGRNQREVERLIGFFVNQIVIRTRFTDNKPLPTLVAELSETIHQAHANAALPFETVVEALGHKRDLARTPLFQNKFVLQTLQRETPGLPGLKVEPFGMQKEIAKFDQLLNVSAGEGGLFGALQYSTALFKPQTVERMVSVLARLMETMARQKHATTDQLMGAMGQQDRELRGEADRQLAAVSMSKLGRRRRRRG